MNARAASKQGAGASANASAEATAQTGRSTSDTGRLEVLEPDLEFSIRQAENPSQRMMLTRTKGPHAFFHDLPTANECQELVKYLHEVRKDIARLRSDLECMGVQFPID